jgi:uncharacterized protein (TIGR01244 family)
MSISVAPVAPDVYVAPQLDASTMAAVAQAGFRSVVNNRPDFEAGADQPTHASIEAAARAAGLEYAFLPVASMMHSPEQVERMAALIDSLPRPMLLFCRSGARSARLFQAAQQLPR